MKDISVIIVNYNVRYFIEQCLYSVYKARKNLNIEIIVIDNNSIDNSVESISRNFPEVKLIANKINAGFAKANNQAIRIVNSKYTLLLNPDTIVSEDTLVKIFEFMENNPSAGALGVKLIDGEGRFLPESKRSIPTPLVSLLRLTGLSKIFPKSRVFNKYNLGYLDENAVNEVDVLCGAFMLIRNEVFEKVGMLDEEFFMYGEDIDLSYRIRKAGYKIFYFPETTTIHFKGESTKKNSVKYHHAFYKAMSIFARKHFGGKFFNFSLFFINTAIFLLGTGSFLRKNLKALLIPVLHFFFYFAILLIIEKIWAVQYHKAPEYYKNSSTLWFYALFSFLTVASAFLYNGYKRNYLANAIKGLLTGTLLIFAIYALLPESMRFSRAIIVFGAATGLLVTVLIRLLTESLFPAMFSQKNLKKRVAIVGLQDEVNKVLRIMDINRIKHEFAGNIYPSDNDYDHTTYIGDISKLGEIIELLKIDEIIFCLKNIGINDVMNYLSEIGNKARIKIFPGDTHSIIGSSDRNSRGEFYSIDINFRLRKGKILAQKYFFDFIIAFIILLFYPLLRFILKILDIKDVLMVLSGRKTWISYFSNDSMIEKLPVIKPGVFFPVIIGTLSELRPEEIHSLNLEYARSYSLWSDLEILFRNLTEKEKLSI
ncbi:MAG: glycosyltransferase [Deltaproteobacteria bacterium]